MRLIAVITLAPGGLRGDPPFLPRLLESPLPYVGQICYGLSSWVLYGSVR